MKRNRLGFIPYLLLMSWSVWYVIHPHSEFDLLATVAGVFIFVSTLIIVIVGLMWAIFEN